MLTRSDALHDALERLEGYGYLDAAGFAVHGPMGAETLSTLGHNDLVASWVEAYKARHQPVPPPSEGDRIDPVDESSWRAALGDYARVADWEAMFRRELEETPFVDLLRTWIPRLLQGYAGALTHGLIRTSHAVRAFPIDREPSPILLTELARGLALLAATFTLLSGRPPLDAALLLRVAGTTRTHPGRSSAVGEATDAAGNATFGAAVEALATREHPDAALSELSTAFCRVLVEPGAVALPLVHTITPIAAVRMLRPLVPDLTLDIVYAHLWRVGAALVSGFTSDATGVGPVMRWSDDAPSPDEVLSRAVAHQDPHALKLADACVREYQLRAEPLYLRAANHLIASLPAW